MFNNCRPYPSIASDSEMKVFPATIPNTLKQKTKKSIKSSQRQWFLKPAIIYLHDRQHFKQEQEVCPYVAQPLCQRNMVRAGNTHVGVSEDDQAAHPHREGGEATPPAGIRCWSEDARQNALKTQWAPLIRSSDINPNPTAATQQTHPPSTSRDFRKNLSGDEYQRCQGVPGAAGDTPTLWGEETCARSALMQLFWFIIIFFKISI